MTGAVPAGVDPRRWVLEGDGLRRAQRRHFVLSVLLPLAGVLLLPLLVPDLHQPVGLAAASFALMGLIAGGLGISVGFHRLFAHRAFSAHPLLRAACTIAGQMAAQGPLPYWVALHRRHHVHSDQPGDPHSPQARAWGPDVSDGRAFWRGHVLWAWKHPVPLPSRYVPDLLADAPLMRLARAYPACVLAGLLLPALMGAVWTGDLHGAAVGLYWGGLVRLVVEHQTIWAINSVCHRFGRRDHATPDESRNNAWLALLSFGESWHNNHHHAPTSARFAHSAWQLDPGWWIIRVLQALGAATRVRRHDRPAVSGTD